MCGVIVMNNNLEIVFASFTHHTIHRTKNQHEDIKKEESTVKTIEKKEYKKEEPYG